MTAPRHPHDRPAPRPPITALAQALYARLEGPALDAGRPGLISEVQIQELLETPRLQGGFLQLRALRGQHLLWPDWRPLQAVALIGLARQLESADLRAQEEQAQRGAPPQAQRRSQAERSIWGLRALMLEGHWSAQAASVRDDSGDLDLARVLSVASGLLTGLHDLSPGLVALRGHLQAWMSEVLRPGNTPKDGLSAREDRRRLLDLTVCEALPFVQPGTPLSDLEAFTDPLDAADRSDLLMNLTDMEIIRWIKDPAQLTWEGDPREQVASVHRVITAHNIAKLPPDFLKVAAGTLGFGPPEPAMNPTLPWINSEGLTWGPPPSPAHADSIREALRRALDVLAQPGPGFHPETVAALLCGAGHPSAASAVELLYLEPPGTEKGRTQRRQLKLDHPQWHQHLALQAWRPLIPPGAPPVKFHASVTGTRKLSGEPGLTGLILARRVVILAWERLRGSSSSQLADWRQTFREAALAEEALALLSAHPGWTPPEQSELTAQYLRNQIQHTRDILDHQRQSQATWPEST